MPSLLGAAQNRLLSDLDLEFSRHAHGPSNCEQQLQARCLLANAGIVAILLQMAGAHLRAVVLVVLEAGDLPHHSMRVSCASLRHVPWLAQRLWMKGACEAAYFQVMNRDWKTKKPCPALDHLQQRAHWSLQAPVPPRAPQHAPSIVQFDPIWPLLASQVLQCIALEEPILWSSFHSHLHYPGAGQRSPLVVRRLIPARATLVPRHSLQGHPLLHFVLQLEE